MQHLVRPFSVRFFALFWAWFCVNCALVSSAIAQLAENRVLVLYNSQGPDNDGNGQSDSLDVYQYYSQARTGVLAFDFNDASLLPDTLSFTEYATKLRDPLRVYLADNNLEEQVAVLTLTTGLPHRIDDANSPGLGDLGNGAADSLNAGESTYASVDSELTLLWQDVSNGEAGKAFDSPADNVILNPFFNQTESITSFDRSDITTARAFENAFGLKSLWRMHEGAVSGPDSSAEVMYLSTRLDGRSVADIKGMIDRGLYPSYNQFVDAVVIDESAAGTLDNQEIVLGSGFGHGGDDYDETAASLAYSNIVFDETNNFLIGGGTFSGDASTQVVTGNVAVLASYGGNHGGTNESGYIESFAGQFQDAIMNTFESYNAKSLGGLGGFDDQGQVADFIAAGGTFAVGNVWEPFAFALSDNEILLQNFFFEGMSWAEAAWSSIPWLSWQQLVIGDPLSRATVILDPQTIEWHGDDPDSGVAGDGTSWSDGTNWSRNGIADNGFQPGDSVVFGETAAVTEINLQVDRIVETVSFESDYTLQQQTLVVRSGIVDVQQGATVTLQSDVIATSGIEKVGDGALLLDGAASAVTVTQGQLSGNGRIDAVRLLNGASLNPDGTLDSLNIVEDYTQSEGSNLIIDVAGQGGLEAGQLVVGGVATLAGTLAVVTGTGYTGVTIPGQSSQFQIVSAGERTGVFDAVTFDGSALVADFSEGNGSFRTHMGDGLFQSVQYQADGVVLVHYRGMPGDTDGDQDVDFVDFTTVSNRFRFAGNWLQGDFDGNGTVGFPDFVSLSANFNFGVPTSITAVPEPVSKYLVLVVASLLVNLRRSGYRAV